MYLTLLTSSDLWVVWLAITDNGQKEIRMHCLTSQTHTRRRGCSHLAFMSPLSHHPCWDEGCLLNLSTVTLKKVKVLVTQPCPTLCDPMNCSLPGSSVHGIFQATILEWVAVSFPGDLLDPGIEPGFSTLQAVSLLPEPPGKPTRGQLGENVSTFSVAFIFSEW